jgi:hypothetical protein
MPIFYTGPEVRITHVWFTISGPEPVRHAIADIECAWVIVPDRHQALSTLRVGCGSAAAMVAVVSLLHPSLDHPTGLVCILTAGWMLMIELRSRQTRTPARYQLWACSDGRAHQLFATSDPVEFGRVKRGLVRAREWQDSLID